MFFLWGNGMKLVVCFLVHWLYRTVIRPAWALSTRISCFLRGKPNDDEIRHEQGLALLRWVSRYQWVSSFVQWLTRIEDSRLRCNVGGVEYANPFLVAAGMFKYVDAAINGMSCFGTSGIVLGSITHEASPGNPRPRMFADGGNICNRMRFNNDGAKATQAKLAFFSSARPLVISISKSVEVDPDDLDAVIADMCRTIDYVGEYADAIELNISSPNSAGLRGLQRGEYLTRFLASLISYIRGKGISVPIFVKFAPDMEDDEFKEGVRVCVDMGVNGIVLTNTTIDRAGLPYWEKEKGGVSGRYLFPKALEKVRLAARITQGKVSILAVGGIFTAEDAWQMLRAGADAFQVLTGLVYQSPMMIPLVLHGLLRRMEEAGVNRIEDIKQVSAIETCPDTVKQ